MTRKDLTLLVIASADAPLGPAHLQKALFLITKRLPLTELGVDSVYTFEPYDYGPFASRIYLDAEELERAGLVVIQRPPESRYKLYRVTEAGADRARELAKALPPDVFEYIRKVVRFIQRLSFNDLVGLIYREFPEMRANSVFKE